MIQKINFNQKLIIIAFVCMALAFVVNKINIKHLYNQSQIEWLNHQKVTTADDAGYIRPAENYLKTGQWKDNFYGYSTYYQRSPGYGGIYLIFKILFKDNAIGFLMLFQTLLFGVGVYMLGKILFIITNQKLMSLVLASLYGLLPSAYGFVFYNITEGITPFLVIMFLYYLFKINAHIQHKTNHFLVAVLGMVLLLTRPQLLPLVMSYPLFIVFKMGLKLESFKKIVLYGLIAFSGFGIWMVRNYKISNQIIALHPIYDNTNNTIFRPTHQALSELYRIWEHKPENLHQSLVPIWTNTINGTIHQKHFINAVNFIPKKVKKIIPKKEWHQLFVDYHNTIQKQKTFYNKKMFMPTTLLKEEQDFINTVNQFKTRLKKELWLTNLFITPLKSYKKTAVHSNLNLYIFQNTFRGNFWMEVLRWLSFLVFSISIFISLWLWLFKFEVLIRVLSFIVFGYTFYLIFFQRMNETRYMHPIYPIAFVLMVYVFWRLSLSFTTKKPLI